MKMRYLPAIVFVVSWLAFLAYWACTVEQLPQRLATHFNLAGQPDGWMTRTQYVVSIAGLGLGTPLFCVGIAYVIRFMPNGLINFPGDHAYWLAPERRAATMTYLFCQSFWPSSMVVGLFAGVHYLMLQANRQGIALVHLSMPATVILLACFLVGFGIWYLILFRHFRYFR